MSTLNKTEADFKNITGDGKVRLTSVYIGIIKANADAQRMGRLQVYIPELGGDPTNSGSWYNLGYASPFAGATPLAHNQANSTAMAGTQKSYGWWAVPPDLDNEVLCAFVQGDPSQGYWFACPYHTLMNHMVPGLAVNHPDGQAGNDPAPVCEYNKLNPSELAAAWDPKRPVFTPLDAGLTAQGLYSDPERGPGTSSARREAPSQVFGFLSPRGNNFHIDDNILNEFIRIRTRSGVQIILHETTGYIYMISKNGNTWWEISDIGIDMYSKRSISMRAEENINIHADGNVLIYSAGAHHHYSGGNHTRRQSGMMSEVAAAEHRRNSPQIHENTQTPASATPQASPAAGPQPAGAAAGQPGNAGNLSNPNAQAAATALQGANVNGQTLGNAQVAGILGNAQQESSFSNANLDSIGNAAHAGIYQFSSSNQAELEQYASATGQNVDNSTTQTNFVIAQITPGSGYTDPVAVSRLNATGFYTMTDPGQAAQAFDYAYERSGETSFSGGTLSGGGNRPGNATTIFGQLTGN